MKTAAAAAAITASALAAGLPAVAAAAIVTVLVLGMVCWVIADAGRSANTAELLRAARGEPPGGQERALPVPPGGPDAEPPPVTPRAPAGKTQAHARASGLLPPGLT